MSGLLKNCRYVIIGPMQYADGSQIRQYYQKQLEPLGLKLFDHYNKPFLYEFDESNITKEYFNKLLEEEKYDELASYKSIRLTDLSIIDRVDFVIFDFSPDVITTGAWEEFYWSVRLKKVCFFVNRKGKNKTPFWIFWCIPHSFIYSTHQDVINDLYLINKGEIDIDLERWKLLKESYR